MYTLHDVEVTKEDGFVQVVVLLQDDKNLEDKKKIGIKWPSQFNFYLPTAFQEIGYKIKELGGFVNFEGEPTKEAQVLD